MKLQYNTITQNNNSFNLIQKQQGKINQPMIHTDFNPRVKLEKIKQLNHNSETIKRTGTIE